jgi:hypothetical protein
LAESAAFAPEGFFALVERHPAGWRGQADESPTDCGGSSCSDGRGFSATCRMVGRLNSLPPRPRGRARHQRKSLAPRLQRKTLHQACWPAGIRWMWERGERCHWQLSITDCIKLRGHLAPVRWLWTCASCVCITERSRDEPADATATAGREQGRCGLSGLPGCRPPSLRSA